MKTEKMRQTLFTLFLFISHFTLAQYATPDEGLTIDFDFLVENSGGVVVMDGDDYLVTDSIFVSVSDVLEQTDPATVRVEENALITVAGGLILQAADPGITFTWTDEELHYKGFRFEDGSVISLENAHFEYGGGLRVLTEDFEMNNCSVSFQQTIASTGGALGFSRGKPEITNSTFQENFSAAINSGANSEFAPVIENCTFLHNGTSVINKSQINLGPSGEDTTFIRNNYVEGLPANELSGGIVFSSLLGVEGHAVIENNEVFNNRYGVAVIGGNITSLIIDNDIYDNDIQGDPMLGGSGINLNSQGDNFAVVTGNTITGNLWGMTLQGSASANLGDTTEVDFNPGENLFEDNGNTGETFALFNNTPNDIPAMNNCWDGMTNLNVEEAEALITHEVDDSELGMVDFTPLGMCEDVGVSELNVGHLSVYPNPATDQINIEASDKIENIRVFDLHGRLILNGEEESKQQTSTLNLSELDQGLYLLQVETEAGLQSKRFFKK